MSRGFKPCLWLPFQLKGQKQHQEGFLFLSWPLPSPAATAGEAIFSSLPLLLPLALQLGLSQPPPTHPRRAEESGEGEGAIKASEVVWLGLQPLNPRPDCWRKTPFSPACLRRPLASGRRPPVLPSLCHAYTWLLLRSSWEGALPRGSLSWVASEQNAGSVPAEHFR